MRQKNTKIQQRVDNKYMPFIFLFLLAFGLRLIRLFDLDLNFDEVVLLFQAELSFKGIWNICKTDNFSPLFPWLVKLWVSISSNLDWCRLLGAILGSLTPPAAYYLGCELNDRKLGLFLGIATAISTSLIFYSQFVRMFNVQPLWVILSVLCFLKALKTDKWRYWLLTAFANLMGFYVYYLMLFVVGAELLVLGINYKLDFKRYLRAFSAYLLFLLGVLLWVIPLLQRYSQLQSGFWIPPISWGEVMRSWAFLGTGTDFRHLYGLAAILNLPFLIGYILVTVHGAKYHSLRNATWIFTCVLSFFVLTTLSGQSFFLTRYFLFIVPIYLAIVFAGWFRVRRIAWRRIGLVSLSFSMTVSLVYYYIDYYDVHSYYGFIRSIPHAEANEGHSLSAISSDVADRIKDDEAIIHYSNQTLRVQSFYASLFYHQHKFSEHIYQKKEISQWNGRQYLRPGEWIRSLYDIDPLPGGVWLITLDSTEDLFNDEIIRGKIPHHWVYRENLPSELKEAGFFLTETVSRGKVSAIHFLRDSGIKYE